MGDDGSDPLAFVIRRNLNRRHLDESQRGAIAEKLATMHQGERTDLPPSANWQNVSIEKAAELMNVGARTIHRIRAVKREAPELVEKIEWGEMTAHGAMREVKEKRREKTRARIGAPGVRRSRGAPHELASPPVSSRDDARPI